MKITKPFGCNILIEPMIESQLAVSEEPSLCAYGKVLAVGNEVKNIKEGDLISFKLWGLAETKVEGVKYYLVPEDDKFILAYVR